MMLGRVVGSLWCTVKNAEMEGQRFLLVQPIKPTGEPTGRRLVCTDSMGAGAGEIVYWVRGREASMPFLPRQVPADATIIAIVDEIHLQKAEPLKPLPDGRGSDGVSEPRPSGSGAANKRPRRGKRQE